MSHGWGFAYVRDLNGLFASPMDVTTHEFYHLLGSCPHSWSLDTCYERIDRLKHTGTKDGVFASLDANGSAVYRSREEINGKLEGWSDGFWP